MPPNPQTSYASSSSDLTAKNTPRTVAKTTPEMEKVKKANDAGTATGIFAAGLQQGLEPYVTGPATGRDLEILKKLRSEATYSYMKWKIRANVGDGEQGLKDHRAAWEELFEDEATWKELLGDEDKDIVKIIVRDVVNRYKEANTGKEDDFKAVDGLASRTYREVDQPWKEFDNQQQSSSTEGKKKEKKTSKSRKDIPERRKAPRLPHPELGEFSADNEKLWKRYDTILSRHLGEWTPQIAQRSKSDSRAKVPKKVSSLKKGKKETKAPSSSPNPPGQPRT